MKVMNHGSVIDRPSLDRSCFFVIVRVTSWIAGVKAQQAIHEITRKGENLHERCASLRKG